MLTKLAVGALVATLGLSALTAPASACEDEGGPYYGYPGVYYRNDYPERERGRWWRWRRWHWRRDRDGWGDRDRYEWGPRYGNW